MAKLFHTCVTASRLPPARQSLLFRCATVGLVSYAIRDVRDIRDIRDIRHQRVRLEKPSTRCCIFMAPNPDRLDHALGYK